MRVTLSRTARMGAAIFAVLVAAGLAFWVAFAWLSFKPSTVDFTAGHAAGTPVHITVQTVGAIGSGAHPTWVSYLVETPQGQWVHTTLWQIPANTVIDVTVLEFDSGSPIRNPENGDVFGTTGPEVIDGKPYHEIDSYASNNNGGLGIAHTFSIPTLGINVPLLGVSNPGANSFCSQGPCTTSNEHNTITFSFKSPGPGQYPWQCFVPCGLGYLYGNGGPMSTLGYMGGFLRVVA